MRRKNRFQFSLTQFRRLYNGGMRNRIRAFGFGLAVALGCLAAAAAGAFRAQAAEPPAVVIVFDGSASMWGNPANEKKSKLALARDEIGRAHV